MKNKIVEILNMTELNYQRTVIQTYIDWCNMHAMSTGHLQLMLINKGMCNWFVREYNKQEELFLFEAEKRQNKVLQHEIDDLYDMFTTKIINYPRPIMFDTIIAAKRNISLSYTEELTNTNYLLN